jgi:hypothetical protein
MVEGAVEAQVEPNGGWNGKGEHERRASDGRWIAFSMAFIAIGVGHVRHNTGKVNQSIENVSDNIKIVGANINNDNVIKKIRLECRRIKCFEGIRCEFVPNREVLQEKTERR